MRTGELQHFHGGVDAQDGGEDDGVGRAHLLAAQVQAREVVALQSTDGECHLLRHRHPLQRLDARDGLRQRLGGLDADQVVCAKRGSGPLYTAVLDWDRRAPYTDGIANPNAKS